MVDGEEQELTRAGVMAHAYSLDPDMRAAAYQELYRVYGEDGVVLGQIYQSLVRDWRNENIDMRKFSSPISVRNLVNDIPDDVINILLDVSEKNAPLFHRFFKLKAKWLGVEKIRRYDLYAPMTKTEKKYEFSEAADLVLDTFAEFDGTVAEMANRVFAENHLDSEIRKGKRGGAFCMPMHQITPWVLMNYLGDPRDVATLAHELGHAIHSMLADRNPLFAHNPSLPLAETASTFSEMLLVDKMLAEETDESVRVDLLFRQVDDAYATIMRQVFFALFERRAHDMIQNGASVDDLCDAYMENLKTQFGDSIELGEEFKWEWVSIPHIYNVPFYVYAYAFGQLLVFALYQQFKAEGDSFKPRYLEILASGGSASTVDILAKAGVDIRTAEFWQGGYDVIAALVDELETIEKPE
jgi:oligoendopeptidase F